MPSDSDDDDRQSGSTPFERVVARVFSSQSAAELAAASLEARGIRCWITTDDAGGMYPTLAAATGVKLFVLKADADVAADLLGGSPATGDSPPSLGAGERAQSQRLPNPRRKIAVGQLLLGIVFGVLLCLLYQWVDRRGEMKFRYDLNGDGRVDELLIYRDGYPKKSFRDRNFDGNWDAWETYDEFGHYASFQLDNNCDGRADVFATYANGEPVTEQWDADFNGTPDVTYTAKHSVFQRAEWRPNGSPVVTLREDYTNGILFETSRDLDGDGNFDQVVRLDAFHNPVSTNTLKALPMTLP